MGPHDHEGAEADNVLGNEEREPEQNVNLRMSEGKFILQMKHNYRISQHATDGLVEETRYLISDYLQSIKSKLLQKLNQQNLDIDLNDDNGVDIFSTDSLFQGIGTRFLQKKFFNEECRLVEAEAVVLGTTLKWQKDGTVKEVKRLGYTVDLLKQLECLLNDQSILSEVLHPHFSTDDKIRDVIDGEFYENHPVFQVHVDDIQILAYYDDLEVANVVGSGAKKHKVGMFYWVLGNIRPCFRSKLKTIYLFAVAKTVHIRDNGLSVLLENFITSLNRLADGHVFMINGRETVMYGGLLAFSGDTLGSNFIGGFKEGVGFAHCKCRHCMCNVNDMSQRFFAELFRSRDLVSHRQHCALLDVETLEAQQRRAMVGWLSGGLRPVGI